ncbi:hypothetical protein Tsubulata_040281, partial [Turnera subulata]
MGVPSFYRWLVNKYPKTVVKAVEEEDVDTSLPNPNGLEYDNLYLDMNGIIHPCFHPDHDDTNGSDAPKTFDDVYRNIYDYIDRIFAIVRPRKLLYLAIDGVAPRGKMNQQRSRRFRSAKDNEMAEALETKLRAEFETGGKKVLPKEEFEVGDSNIITPGTAFMFELSRKLQEYNTSRMTNNLGWNNIQVILSDANAPGEGEHKIMLFIRQQRTLPHYDPNTRHCLYGLDADLIMLALASHEVHFSILREDVMAVTPDQQSWSGSISGGEVKRASLNKKPYEFLHIWILREYLELDLKITDPPDNFSFDFERIIDDFVFLCFFAGNDFLPHMPTLEIHEGAIDLLMTVYKQQFKNLGGYLVDMQLARDPKNAFIKLKRVEKFILQVGTYEEKIFQKRLEIREKRLKRLSSQYLHAEDDNQVGDFGTFDTSNILPSSSDADKSDIENTKELKEKVKFCLRQEADLFKQGGLPDKLKLGVGEWKARYFKEKFSAESKTDIESMRKQLVQKYTEGLMWVLLYYFSGVPSWNWFYPFHYAPFASDLKGLTQVKVKFEKGCPFKPFDQLMAVLPARSAHALPKAYEHLMTDKCSEIIDFYPSDFDVDTDGKRFAWQGICKLPFIDEARLLAATRTVEKNLEIHEMERNKEDVEKLFVRTSSIVGAAETFSLDAEQVIKGKREEDLITINLGPSAFGGITHLRAADFPEIKTVTVGNVLKSILERKILCVQFELPEQCQHIPRPLPGVNFPEKEITEKDIEETQLWHESQTSRYYDRRGMSSNNQHFHSKQEHHHHHPTKFSSSSSPGWVHKGSGSGWGGRGRGYCHQEEANKFQNLTLSEPSRGISSYRNAYTDNAWARNNAGWESSSSSPAGRGNLHGGRLAASQYNTWGSYGNVNSQRGYSDTPDSISASRVSPWQRP